MAAEPADATYRVVEIEIRPVPDQPPALELHCPCPARGLRCGDCCLIAFAPPPFRATPLGWTLATGRRLGWRIRELLFGPPTDIDG